MKKTARILISLLLVVSLAFTFAACTPKEKEPVVTKKQQILNYFEELQNMPTLTAVNTFYTGYDDMITYLKAQGVISSTATAVNMLSSSTGKGYFIPNGQTAPDAAYSNTTFANKAYDYDGVYVLWYDLLLMEESSLKGEFDQLPARGKIIAGGGAYLLDADKIVVSGSYAICFRGTVESGSAAETARNQAVTKFNSIDKKVYSLHFMNFMDFAEALKEKGFISDVLGGIDLNAKYTYDTYGSQWNSTTSSNEFFPSTGYVSFATTAQDYDGIQIYYYNVGALSGNMLTYYRNALLNIKSVVSFSYYANETDAKAWKTTNATYKFDANNNYSANGTQLTLEFETMFGRFALNINDNIQ